MEKNKGLVGLVILLSVLVLGLVGYIVYNNTEDDNSIKLENLNESFKGNYKYGKKNSNAVCNPNGSDISNYYDLVLNNDGTYSYSYGTNCGSGYVAKGNYSISNDTIYLYNDNCNVVSNGNECIYPNCNKIIELNYSIVNNEITVNVNGITLEK